MHSLVEELSLLLSSHGMMLATAESCTGGMIAAAMTDRAGSSTIFDRGFVTYSNEAKSDMIGVNPDTIQTRGAVSEQTAREMVLGTLKFSCAGIAVAVTGIAGPSGGTDEKPVGLVYISVATKDSEPETYRHIFDGDRLSIRQQTMEQALQHLINSFGLIA